MANNGEIEEFLRNRNNVAETLPGEIVATELMAEGGQAVVYRGTAFGAEAAIKIYFPGQLQKRIEREVEALTRLDNRNLVRLLWHGTLSVKGKGIPVVATNLIPGYDLKYLIENRPFAEREIGIIAFDVAGAINAMWKRRIVHRDLKPSNIVVMPNDRACVIDLGIARHVDLTTLTAAGFFWGTFGYLSPEQTQGVKQLTCKSDVYALGIILTECALGRHPTGDQLRLLSINLHENLPPEISDWEYAELLRDMIHPRPTKRPRPVEIMERLKKYAPN
jgi:serine/threonine protein kinase